MHKAALSIALALVSLAGSGQTASDALQYNDIVISNPYGDAFRMAYEQYPDIPEGILEAVAFTNTRFQHLDPEKIAPACTGLPPACGVMGLMADGNGVFRNTLAMTAALSGISAGRIKADPAAHVLAYAAAYSATRKSLGITGMAVEDHYPVLAAMSEIPPADPAGNFALNSNIYTMYAFLDDAAMQSSFGLPHYRVDFVRIFGEENYRVLSAPSVTLAEGGIRGKNGDRYTPVPSGPDYPNSIWDPAASCNYSVGRSQAISAVAIHTMQGTYGGTIYWFKDCGSNVSTQYVMRASDGQITQMVLEANTAQHVYTENPYTIGIEHEGYINDPSWYTTAMYNSSAALVRDICDAGYGISSLTAFYEPGCSGNYTSCLADGCVRIKGHQMFPNGGHTDPGPSWDWSRYFRLLNPEPVHTPLTAASGTVYDSGGPNGNYGNTERPFTLISPAGATTVTLQFNSFDTEADYDHLFIYDGNTANAPLIGKYSGTASPGTITSSGPSLLLEFRSDCSQNRPGWSATWSAPGLDAIPPTTSISAPAGWVTGNFTAAFADADEAGGSGLDKRLFQVADYNGSEWRANTAAGFFRDEFQAALHAAWTTGAGTWSVSNGDLLQTDETVSNSLLSASLTQGPNTRYLYTWSAAMEGSGTNRRSGLHFFCDNASQDNRGNSYLVWFRQDQQTVEIYKSAANVLGSPVKSASAALNAGNNDFAVSYDRVSGVIRVYVNGAMAASWTDASPLTSGSYVSFRSGNCISRISEFNVYRSRAAAETITVGSASDFIRYQNNGPSQPAGEIRSIVMDIYGNLSSMAVHFVNADWTRPAAVATVNDGTGADISLTTGTTALSANWTSSSDPHSDIARYRYAIGTSPGDSGVAAWTDNGTATAVTRNGLSLTPGTTYYISVRAENGAGLLSDAVSSDGQTVGTTTALDEAGPFRGISVYPNPMASSAVLFFGLSRPATVHIGLTDMLGQGITVARSEWNAGSHRVEINADGLGLARGIYVLRLQSGDSQAALRLIVQ